MVEELATEQRPTYPEPPLKDFESGRRVLAMSPEDQRALIIASVSWMERRSEARAAQQPDNYEVDHPMRRVRSAIEQLLRRKLPFEHDDVIALLDWSLRQQGGYARCEAQMTKVSEDYAKAHPTTPELRERIERLIELMESEYNYDAAATRKRIARLRKVSGLADDRIPLVAGESWSDVALREIEGESEEMQAAWVELLNLCTDSTGSKPSARWFRTTERPLEVIGLPAFRSAVLRWFPLVDRPRTQPVERSHAWQPDPNLLINEKNADILKGLVWLCAGHGDGEMARALMDLALSAYRKVPQVGPRCVRVGNACVWALGEMPGTAAIGQLAVLNVRVKFGTAQKGIEKALDSVAEREGVPRDEIWEMSVPSYGLEEVGLGREKLGEFTAELIVTGTSSTEVRWIKPDGKRQKSVPKAVREGFAEELKALKSDAREIQKMLPAQRDRIENLYLDEKSWTYPVWRERYLDHLLTGTLARRLIWTFSEGGRKSEGIWHDGEILDRHGQPLDWLGERTRVGLWHPIGSSTGEVLAWRDRLAELEIRQPFKQAHREVYLLTDAERRTGTYSNRFAAHILKQHQFNALCAARGWKNDLRLMVDDVYSPASRTLPRYGLRAEYWIEGIGEEYGTDTTEAGTFLYVATDQVRFYSENAPENTAHAGGGGYSGPIRRLLNGILNSAPTDGATRLDEVPPLVFSEIMRDADLFVGVASVGNDPNWNDGGPEGRYRDYWTQYSFGDLSETARTRKVVLERLLPRLRISDRCDLTDRFLVVRGDVRTYRIHLGSGNILMEPNDQYLCIVPSQGAGNSLSGKVYLPFEGDRTMAIILSKAFLLADDAKIEDPTILRQIQIQR